MAQKTRFRTCTLRLCECRLAQILYWVLSLALGRRVREKVIQMSLARVATIHLREVRVTPEARVALAGEDVLRLLERPAVERSAPHIDVCIGHHCHEKVERKDGYEENEEQQEQDHTQVRLLHTAEH